MSDFLKSLILFFTIIIVLALINLMPKFVNWVESKLKGWGLFSMFVYMLTLAYFIMCIIAVTW